MHLVDDYDPESGFFFGTSARSLLTRGSAVVLPGRGGLAPRRAETVLAALGADQILVGAIPFDDHRPAHLVVPEDHRWGPALPPETGDAPSRPVTPRHEPPPEEYRRAVAEALDRIGHSDLSKVVLARSVRIPLPEPVRIPRLLRRLRQAGGFVFGCALPGHRVLVGGSPELLVSRDGDTVVAHPLAGSRPRAGDPAIDRRRAAELLDSDKDRREHALVVADIAKALAPFCRDLSAPPRPEIVTTSHMMHLGTRITGVLAEPRPSALSLAAALHPTPAVCGTPTGTAQETIRRLEGFDRDFYAGMVGWCDSTGDGEWAVTIRCAELAPGGARLFAGAGVVAGSTPEAELAETDAKLATMLSALGARLDGEEVGRDRRIHAVA
ncbi:isochorismate synthase [Stackebrandtia albiflava]|uniref:isochorismate synthase n=1 Tax=Stackebrandtia albiflava TaxID=406432 RepID=A0A562VBI4_9ACTN|nr:isochorismate synthase [Stackebrandtia albiflava]TWJ15212.1 isochorismate synthase [Stackebrandtia albiflava]